MQRTWQDTLDEEKTTVRAVCTEQQLDTIHEEKTTVRAVCREHGWTQYIKKRQLSELCVDLE